MAPRLTDLEVPTPEAWDHLLEGVAAPVRFFHTSAATAALAEAFPEYEDRRCRARFEDGSDLMLPLVRARRRVPALSALVGLPLSWPGSPLAIAGEVTTEKIEAILTAAGDAGELRVFGGGLPGEARLGAGQGMETHLLDLEGGFDHVWERRMTGKARNMCRKAQGAGLRVEHIDTAAGMPHFRRLYVEATRDWGYADPPHPDALFQALSTSPGVEVTLAWSGDRPVAGTISLRGVQDLFQWATVMSRDHRDIAPTNGLLAFVIEDACARGFRWYDMGSSRGLPGVAAFKESFGAERATFGELRIRTLLNRVATVGTDLIRRARRPRSGNPS